MKPELTPSLIQSAWQLFFCSSTSSIHLFILIHACSFRRQSRGGKKKIYECMYVGSCCHGNRSPDTIFTNRDSPCACVCWMGEKNALWSGIGFKKWVREDPILLLPFLCMSAWAHAHLCVCVCEQNEGESSLVWAFLYQLNITTILKALLVELTNELI